MDMDGTMLNSRGVISERTVNALKLAQEKGVLVTVDSGRYPENAWMEMVHCGLSLPVIGTNGTKTITASGEKISLHPMDADAALRVRRVLDEADCRYYMYGDDYLASAWGDDIHHSERKFGREITERFPFSFLHGREEMKRVWDQPVLKFYVWDNGDLEGLKKALQGIEGICLTRSAVDNMEISPGNISKASGLREMAEKNGILLSEVMAFGDQDNDLPMLLTAGYGFAMANGDPEVIRRVRYTAPSNDEDGIAAIVEKYVL